VTSPVSVASTERKITYNSDLFNDIADTDRIKLSIINVEQIFNYQMVVTPYTHDISLKIHTVRQQIAHLL
jgi:hypothetical protein